MTNRWEILICTAPVGSAAAIATSLEQGHGIIQTPVTGQGEYRVHGEPPRPWCVVLPRLPQIDFPRDVHANAMQEQPWRS
ncbi:hypothetical protein SE18_19375 [Herpetosiphon geysericola]|uniref:Uncharacterized protein n=1 Tax=Herpetosiphon geysericola TaxID=70996 RepID=A0A0P6XHJ0_9CHLR|nr:hypothetical protein SE18_19375 [Herpetosiphon geysericola]